MKYIISKCKYTDSTKSESFITTDRTEGALIKVALKKLMEEATADNWEEKENLSEKYQLLKQMINDIKFANTNFERG